MMTGGVVAPVRLATIAAWKGWKVRWRKLETADPVLSAKRRIRQVLGTEPPYRVETRVPTSHFGGWCVASHLIGPQSVAYCIRVGEDIEFDLALLERFGAEVHAFDPTPRAIEYVASRPVLEGYKLHQLGVAEYDGVASFKPSPDERNPSFTMLERAETEDQAVTAEVCRLSTIMEMLGHRRLDVLKIDIEGAEYGVLRDVLGARLDVRQILVEFHHRFAGIGMAKTCEAVDSLHEAGYRIFYISPSGREYSLVGQP